VEARGSTDIHAALQRAMSILAARPDGGRPAYVVFLTDGLPTAGVRDESRILKDATKANTVGARLFVFGVGYDVNVRLLDKLARDKRGRSDYVKPAEPIEAKVSALYRKIKNPVMTGLEVRVEGLRLYDVYPREIGDLFEGDQIVLAGRYELADGGELSTGESGLRRAKLLVAGKYLGERREFTYPVSIEPPARRGRYAFVEKLWAIRRVGYLLDQIALNGESKELVDELVLLSREYGIMTPYTAFLADETVSLASREELGRLAERKLKRQRIWAVSGADAQRNAKNRQYFYEARQAVPAFAPAEGGTKMLGSSSTAAYEAGQAETVSRVRQVGNQALYRRGNVVIASNAAWIDPDRDADKVKVIERFSKEYFELVRFNTMEENRILASQAADEELVISLRGQVYRIR